MAKYMKEIVLQLYCMNYIKLQLHCSVGFFNFLQLRSEKAAFLNGVMVHTWPIVLCTQLLLHSTLPNLKLTG